MALGGIALYVASRPPHYDFAKLVGILREGKYDKTRGRFRACLSTLLFHGLIGCVRKEQARRVHRRVPVEERLSGSGTTWRHLRGGCQTAWAAGGVRAPNQIADFEDGAGIGEEDAGQ